MANDLSLSLRIPSLLLSRLEDLRDHLETDPELAYLGEDLSRSMLVRLALQRGVELLEELYDVVPPASDSAGSPSGTPEASPAGSARGRPRTETLRKTDRPRRRSATTRLLRKREREKAERTLAPSVPDGLDKKVADHAAETVEISAAELAARSE